jgi:hypothetical protein
MAFWQTDFPALLLDFGHVVEDTQGTQVRGILAEQDVVTNDGAGDVLIRATTLTVPSGSYPDLATGDTVRTWLPDAPTTVLSWMVRDILVRQDGTPTRLVVAAR